MGAKENAKKRFEEMNTETSDQPKRTRGPIQIPWRGTDLCRINPFFCDTVPSAAPKPTPYPTPARGRQR